MVIVPLDLIIQLIFMIYSQHHFSLSNDNNKYYEVFFHELIRYKKNFSILETILMSINLDDWDARYGHGLIEKYSEDYRSYIAITSPSAWKAVEKYLVFSPIAKEYVNTSELEVLENLVKHLPSAKMVCPFRSTV